MSEFLKIIIAVVVALIGAVFLYWGIYQLKTGKMVAKRAKKPIDEPRQVGILFIALGLSGLCLSLVIADLSSLLTTIISSVLLIGCSALLLFISIYGFKNQRIFGVKNTERLHKITKKFYKIVNILLLITSCAILVILLCGDNFPCANYIATIIAVVSCVVTTCFLLRIESKFKKSK